MRDQTGMIAGENMRAIYLILICFAAPVAALIAWARGVRDPSRRERLADRFGKPIRPSSPVDFWVHAASMGEVQVGAVLVRALLSESPTVRVVMTTMTTTGAARVKALFSERVDHAFLPYDLPFAVQGFLDRVRPKALVIMETELWPTLLSECRRRDIPVAIVSARISQRTADRYRTFAQLFRGALEGVSVAAQTETDAQRFRDLGARDIAVTGNMKFDIDVPDAVRDKGRVLRAEIGPRFVWVAGSTHAGEEQIVLDAHRLLRKQVRDALLLLVPRHPQRFAEVRAWLQSEQISFSTRSHNEGLIADAAVLLVDTMGELQSCYAGSDAAFVGGTLVPIGGHNLLEPAALGVPVLCGPHTFNAPDVAATLTAYGGVKCIDSAQSLAAELVEVATVPEKGQDRGRRAQQAIADNRGSLDRVLKALRVRMTKRA
jgi:3-deoxy-D-manno-octulosonic-acid transferase